MKVKAIDEVLVFSGNNFYHYPVGTIFEVVETKYQPHDKEKMWYRIKINTFVCDGFSNPNDFEVLK